MTVLFDKEYIGKKVEFIKNYYQNGNALTCKAGTIGEIVDYEDYNIASVKVEGKKRIIKLYNHAVSNGDVRILDESIKENTDTSINNEKYKKFTNELNEISQKYEVVFNYDPADGLEAKTNFKYVEFEYNDNIFHIKTKAVKLGNESTLQYIQELSIAAQLLPKLKKIALDSLVYMI